MYKSCYSFDQLAMAVSAISCFTEPLRRHRISNSTTTMSDTFKEDHGFTVFMDVKVFVDITLLVGNLSDRYLDY
jgi:hypothetical protein